MPCFTLFKKQPASQTQEKITWENTVDFGALTDEKKRQFIKDLPTLDTKTLTLVNCNVSSTPICFKKTTYYLPKVLAALAKNQSIISLTLGDEFLSIHENHRIETGRDGEVRDGGVQRTYRPSLDSLKQMSALKSLTMQLPAEGTSINFDGLSVYLTDPANGIETLQLSERGLTPVEGEYLIKIIRESDRLKYYRGPCEREIQPILDSRITQTIEASYDDMVDDLDNYLAERVEETRRQCQ